MKINFEVSAKAARLIGRENIADVDGALIELIKNAYDADATCVWVDFKMPFPEVPTKASISRFSSVLSNEDYAKALMFYDVNNGELIRKENLSDGDKVKLQSLLFGYNCIIIADNGTGMELSDVESSWMQIGTSNKEYKIKSESGRIKTGAKGIGRFALDKLSIKSTMYTRTKNASTIRWDVDWEQFTNAKLLKDVKADVSEMSDTIIDLLKSYIGLKEFNKISNHNWNKGTIIVLTPVREAWNQRLFTKVNTNLKSINPLGSVDLFNVIINNRFYPEYSYETKKVSIDSKDYDYRIKVEYIGGDELIIKILRNEFDLKRTNITLLVQEQSKIFELNQFWSRKAFEKEPYRKEDYDQELILSKPINTFLKFENIDKIHQIGSFEAELFFLKNANNDYEIVKSIAVRNRKNLLNKFTGIKLYRDNFKVRPYGDEGSLYDWLELGTRVQKSPAPVSHSSGSWRVQPYQIIGTVKISRADNPMLYDMANREGLTLNDAYFFFIKMLQEAIKCFEYDRQYIYREYSKWRKECESTFNKTALITEDILNNVHQDQNQMEKTYEKKSDNTEYQRFSEDDYRQAVHTLLQDSQRELKAKQTLEAMSSSGVILNTFFHEFSAINTQFHSRSAQLRKRINYILNGKEFSGLPAYNPYNKLDDLEKTDKLLAAWLDVVMQGIEPENLVGGLISLKAETHKILEMWKELLDEKSIFVDWSEDENTSYEYSLAIVDLYIILNNFILNSIWFLEKSYNIRRCIRISFFENSEKIILDMENNGPSLAPQYKNSPTQIFEIDESGKTPKGTGLGLWLTRETVERNNGKITVMEKDNGFGIQIEWQK